MNDGPDVRTRSRLYVGSGRLLALVGLRQILLAFDNLSRSANPKRPLCASSGRESGRVFECCSGFTLPFEG